MGIIVLILKTSFVLGTMLPLTLTTSNFITDQGGFQSIFWINKTIYLLKLFADLLPEFTNVLQNISVPIERDVTFTCNVKNIGKYKVKTPKLVNENVKMLLYLGWMGKG